MGIIVTTRDKSEVDKLRAAGWVFWKLDGDRYTYCWDISRGWPADPRGLQ